MGYAIAEKLADCGAEVILISGKTELSIKNQNIQLIKVVSAQEMYQKCIVHFNRVNGAIMVAAVADYTPVSTSNHKIKKLASDLVITLKPTVDIAAELGKLKKENQLLIGFALETDNELENAHVKLQKKNLDFIVLNSLNEQGAGFEHNTNKITIIDKNNNIEKFQLKLKHEVAADIVDKLIKIV